MATEDTIVVRLGVTPEQLIGYAYSGFLAFVIGTIIDRSFAAQLVEALGGFLTAVVALTLGVGIYVFYFRLLGEFVLYPFQHLVHSCLDWVRGRTAQHPTSCIGYLGAFGVPIGLRRAAYEATKALYYKDLRVRRRIQLAHGEIHVLYLTAVETVAAAIYVYLHDGHAGYWIAFAAAFYLAALIADVHQHSLECGMLKSPIYGDLGEFLDRSGFLAKPAKASVKVNAVAIGPQA